MFVYIAGVVHEQHSSPDYVDSSDLSNELTSSNSVAHGMNEGNTIILIIIILLFITVLLKNPEASSPDLDSSTSHDYDHTIITDPADQVKLL